MNPSQAQTKYKELQAKIRVAERAWPVGMAAGLERLTLKNDLNHFRQKCLDQGITLLEPCPFCGSYDVSRTSEFGIKSNELYWIDCQYCQAEGPTNHDRSVAIAAWNTRTH